jgi:hypothetical protein
MWAVSPYGPHSPGHQAAEETSSCAPESRRRSVGSSVQQRETQPYAGQFEDWHEPWLFGPRSRRYGQLFD